MKKVRDIYHSWKDRLAKRKERVHRMIELKRLQRTRSKYIPPYEHCQNCGTKLRGMYCHTCGQFAHDNSQPFWKYVWQYFENVYQFDYKIPVTVWQLFRRPGFLTNEFNAGKIVSYMHPMKLNMFILVIFFTIVIFMGEKVVDEQFTQANISGYIQENLALDSQYFSGKDTTIFFIGNPYLLEDYPDIFTIKKRLSGKHSVKKLSNGEKVQIPELPEEAYAENESSLASGVMKMSEDMRMNAFYTYDDEQTGHDTILLSLPRANTVGCAHTFETITFGGTCVSVTFGFCGNVNFFANFKSVCFDDVANVYCGTIVKSEFTKEFFCSNICFCKMSFKGFGEMFFGDLAVADLYGFVTVVFKSFLLNNDAGTGFNNGYRNYFSCLVKKLGHTNLFADDCLFH